jgi:hypothetical protein
MDFLIYLSSHLHALSNHPSKTTGIESLIHLPFWQLWRPPLFSPSPLPCSIVPFSFSIYRAATLPAVLCRLTGTLWTEVLVPALDLLVWILCRTFWRVVEVERARQACPHPFFFRVLIFFTVVGTHLSYHSRLTSDHIGFDGPADGPAVSSSAMHKICPPSSAGRIPPWRHFAPPEARPRTAPWSFRRRKERRRTRYEEGQTPAQRRAAICCPSNSTSTRFVLSRVLRVRDCLCLCLLGLTQIGQGPRRSAASSPRLIMPVGLFLPRRARLDRSWVGWTRFRPAWTYKSGRKIRPLLTWTIHLSSMAQARDFVFGLV